MLTRAIERQLHEWQSQGLLSAEQLTAIVAYEKQKPSKNRIMLGITSLAILSMALGIISIIAANWDQIPAFAKLLTYFLLLTGIGSAAIRYEERPGAVREGLIFGFNLLVLAGIGLIAQVYHLPSDGWRGFALWSVLTLATSWKARMWPTAATWYGGLILASSGWLSGVSSELSRVQTLLPVWVLGFGILVVSSRRGRGELPTPLRSVGLTLSIPLVLLIFPALLAIWTRKLEASFWILWAIAALGFGLWVALERKRKTLSRLLAAISGLMLIRAIYYSQSGSDWMQGSWNLLEALLLMPQLLLMGMAALTLGRPRLFDLCLMLIAIRIFILFAALFGGLLMTGFGLIAMGLVTLMLLRLWYRSRDQWQEAVRRLIPK